VDNLLPVVDELVQCRKYEQSAGGAMVNLVHHMALSTLR
jgi:hypothetical protein